MTQDLQDLKKVRVADVYKGGALAGNLTRMADSGVRFGYRADYEAAARNPVAFSLPFSATPIEASNGALPPFFTGLLPEGHRLTVLRNAAKTSLDDELTLLLAVGSDVPGDVQVVPSGAQLVEPDSVADASRPEDLDFAALAESVDRHGLPGVQSKARASMLTTPLAMRGMRYLLKLDPAENPHLVLNEAAHLAAATGLKIPVARHSVVRDKNNLDGLLVERFDRIRSEDRQWCRPPLEDGTQIMGMPPAAKYSVSSEHVSAE